MGISPTSIVAPPLSRTRVRTDSRSWYRQFWPWFLIALPAISVVFSFATLYIAVSGADEVVPHEGDSSSYAAPRAPALTVSEERPVPVAATRSEPAAPHGADIAVAGEGDHGTP
jgi:hypothetical protein